MKKYFILSALLWLSFSLSAQFAEDALRFSELYRQGTARNMAVGGAQGSLGGDFSAISTNPGGLAIYRKGELSITPEVFSRKNTALYSGVQIEDSRTIFDLANFGWVSAKPLGRGGKGWKYYQLAFGMNRLNNFNSNVVRQGNNIFNSRLDVFKEQADGIYYGDIEDGYYPDDLTPAWWLYLLDTIPGTTDQYYTPLPFAGTRQTQIVNTRGSVNEYLFAGAANFDDVVYIGASVAMPFIRFFRDTYYSEVDVADTIPYFDRWSMTEYLETSGAGINLKAGIIVRPVDWLRVGAAFHSPTWYFSMNDDWWVSMSSDLEWFQGDTLMPWRTYSYKLNTPLRVLGNLAFVIKKNGFISVEYEFVNYGSAKLDSRDYDFGWENNDIETSFGSTHNIRAGAEWRYSRFSFRGGFALYGSPYQDNLNDGSRTSYSGGIGYRSDHLGIDFAYVYSTKKEDYYFYTSANPYYQPDAVDNTITDQNFTLTFRYIF